MKRTQPQRKRALPYIDCRPTPIAWRERPEPLTVTLLMRIGRVYRALREQARVAAQLYFCARGTPGDSIAAYVVVIGTVVVSLLVLLGVHLAAW